MIIGTMHKEEARVFDRDAGYHQFRSEDGKPYGSFEIYWNEGNEYESAGWYWQPCFEGCLPDGDSMGPFGTSMRAFADAQEGAECARNGHRNDGRGCCVDCGTFI